MPKVSVIIPTHNRAQFLRSAITSVLNQTYQDFEIIVVDDASNDPTDEVVRTFKDPRIKYVRHDVNKGEAGATNTGVRNAAGEFIAFLHDDDEWLPEKLEKQVDLLQRSLPVVGGIYTGFAEIDRVGGTMLRQIIPVKKGNISHAMASRNWIGTPSTVLLRRVCLNKVGLFDENIDHGTDYDMWIRISKEFYFECIEEPLVKYCIHDNRLSTNYAKIISGHEARLRKYGSFLASDSKSQSRRYSDLGVVYVCNGETNKGREAFLEAIRIYPFQIKPYRNLCLSLLGAKDFKKLRYTREKLGLQVRRYSSHLRSWRTIYSKKKGITRLRPLRLFRFINRT